MSLDTTDLSACSIQHLIADITDHHHQYLRREIPHISSLIDQAIVEDGDRFPNLPALRKLFVTFGDHLLHHLQEEEQDLFPLCIRLENTSDLPARDEFARLSINHLMDDHNEAAMALGWFNELTDGFRAPADASNAHRRLIDSLRALQADMHQHIMKENCLLFPRAIELSNRRR
jgi:regulator of cell morphogenesis and NO signaling